jgi:subtilase family serine protease
LLFSIVTLLPRASRTQVTFSPGARFCEANTGVSGGQESSHHIDINQARAGAGNVMLPTPKLEPGKETTLEFPIPNGCYPPGFSTRCNFKIIVDAALQVSESNEKNNTAQSFCSKPAG